jgi:hypothetical protein
MLRITHTTPKRLLGHLRKLQRDGEALLARPTFLSPWDEAPWEVRVWRCLDKIADRGAFDSALERDSEDLGPVDLLSFKSKPADELDQLLRRRIGRRVGTLASVIEKVEAIAELPPRRAKKMP